MAQQNTITSKHEQEIVILKPVLIGAAIGLFLIAFFLSGTNDPNPGWGSWWMIKPLIMVPVAGAAGGLFFAFMNHLSNIGKLNRVASVFLSVMVFIIGIWMGIVLGLNGTMWD